MLQSYPHFGDSLDLEFLTHCVSNYFGYELMSLCISWFPRLFHCGRWRSLEFTITVTMAFASRKSSFWRDQVSSIWCLQRPYLRLFRPPVFHVRCMV